MSKEAIMYYTVAERAGEEANNNGFNALRSEAMSLRDQGIPLANWLTQCEVDEVAFMKEHYENDPKAKFKSGQWKFRTYLPRAYYTAKKAIESGWRNGVDIDQGKSAIEKAVAKVNRRDLSWDERMLKVLRQLDSLYDAEAVQTLDRIGEWIAKHQGV